MKKRICVSIVQIIVILFSLAVLTDLAYSQCGTTYSTNATNISSSSATVQFGCSSCSSAIQILEYGLAGFTPGSGATAGAGGTVVTFATYTTSYTFTGLQASTTYNFYFRLNCGSGIFTGNSAVRTFTTAFNCATASVINCNTNVNVTTTPVQGPWNLCTNGFGNELVYSFTPTASGTHLLVVPNPNNHAYFAYKAASLGCDNQNWNCIGTAAPGTVNQFSVGPLTAGTQYYFAVDPIITVNILNATFRIECPTCSPASNLNSTVSPYSIKLNWTGSAGVIEYGPTGFIPGTGANPGSASSTVVTGGSGTTILNLAPATTYDFYVRINCGNGSYSINSSKLTATTLSCPVTINYGTLGSDLYIQFGQTPVYPEMNNCSFFAPGDEHIVTFTPPGSGYYNLKVVNGNSSNGLGYSISSRVQNAICNLTGYSNCLTPSFVSNTDIYTVGPLNGGTTYQFLFDVQDTSICQIPPCSNSLVLTFSCPSPEGIAVSNIQPNQITATWNCNCPSTTYIEYGPDGFTPGTNATAGSGGTVISGVSTPYNLTGLLTDTKYDIYLRSSCGGVFTANSNVVKTRTSQSCSSAPVINCGSYFNYQVYSSGPQVGGSWESTACGGSTNSKEAMWKFTPAVSGNYSLYIYNFFANSVNYQYPVKIFTKTAASPCNEQNWTCAASASFSHATFVPAAVSIGTLTAGTAYLIMVDGVQPTFTAGYTYSFRLECPNVCSTPIIQSITSITSNSAVINGICNNCTGSKILEYGPVGFNPGTGSTPGSGGTIISNFSYPVTLTGLSSGSNYSIYVRQNCGGSLGFSSNLGPTNFTTTGCSTAPVTILNSLGTNSVCAGTTLTLTQNGGMPGAGGSIKWYSSSCGGTFIGIGNSITVTPTTNTLYYVRAEATCGISTCAVISISVNQLPTATIVASGPTTFCAGGNVTLNANTGTGLTYLWKKYGNPIAGATSSSYVATGAGVYKVVVTNAAGCSATSSSVTVTVNPLPAATATAIGSTAICPGSSVTFNANTGAGLNYQWKKYSNDISGATGATYAATGAGTYKVRVTNANGCSKNSNSIVLTSLTAPVATITATGATTFCAGDSVKLAAASGAGNTYQWRKGSSVINGATGLNYYAKTTGNYKVTVAATNGCTKNSNVIAVNVPCRVGESSLSEFNIYPNPTSGKFRVTTDGAANGPATLKIKDMTGKMIYSSQLIEKETEIDLSAFADGIYLTELQTTTNRLVHKLILQK